MYISRREREREHSRVVDEGGPAVPLDEGRMRDDRDQERDVRLDTADPELDEGAKHLPPHNLVCGRVTAALDQHRVVEGRDDGAGEAVATVETNTVAAGGTVHLDLPSVGCEALGRVLGRDPALNGISSRRDTILRDPELLQRDAGGDLNLSRDDVDAGNLLRHRVLDLTVSLFSIIGFAAAGRRIRRRIRGETTSFPRLTFLG